MKKAIGVGVMVLSFVAALVSGQQIRLAGDDSSERAKSNEQAMPTSVLLRAPDGQLYRKADVNDTFFNGQRFRLQISPLQDGYLYVLCQNSQGSGVLLYPNSFGSAANRVHESHPVTIPNKSWFQFDEEPGRERVYLVLAENPIVELDRAARRGGDISMEMLDRYTHLDSTRSLGIIDTDEGNIFAQRIDLQHESR